MTSLRALGWLALVLALAPLASCGPRGNADDAGSAGNDTGVVVDAAVDPATAAAIADTMRALAVAASLSAPLAPSGDMLRRDLMPDSTANMRAEDGFSGMSVVEPPTCAAYVWSGLSATVTLTGCTLEATGLPISGSVTLAVETRPVTFTVTFTALAIDGTTYDGHVAFALNGTDASPMPPSLDIDLTTTDAGGTMHLTATGITVTTTTSSIAISGSASITQGGPTTAVTLDAVTWQTGQCLPSSGSASLTTGVLTTMLTFLTTTPTDGIVTVTVPPFPSSMQPIFPPCP